MYVFVCLFIHRSQLHSMNECMNEGINLHNYLIKQECNKSEILVVQDENYNGISNETYILRYNILLPHI